MPCLIALHEAYSTGTLLNLLSTGYINMIVHCLRPLAEFPSEYPFQAGSQYGIEYWDPSCFPQQQSFDSGKLLPSQGASDWV